MKLIYIAGKYRAKTLAEMQANINLAWKIGAEVVAKLGKYGYFPVVPHLNTQHMDGLQSDEYFLAGTAELLRRGDAMLLIGDWKSSEGARGEKRIAWDRCIPVYYSVEKIVEFEERKEDDNDGNRT